MLKFNELQKLKVEELGNVCKPVSAKLVPQLVSKGILKEGKAIHFKGLEVEYPTYYTVEDNKLFSTYNNVKREEYVIGLLDKGFNVVSADGEDCANIYIDSVEEDYVNAWGGFVLLCQVDMFDMED